MPQAGALGGGFSAGVMESQLDLQAIQQGQQKLQLGQWALAEAPIKLQEEQITLQKDKMQLAQQTRMLSLMQNLKPPADVNSPDAMADVLDQMASIYLQSGMPDAAGKMAKEASGLRENASKIDSRSYRMQNDRLSKFANILDGVPDSPQGFTAAIQAMVAADPGVARDKRFVELAQQPWRPGLMEDIKRGVLTAKEQAEINYRKKAGDHAEAAAAADRERIGLIDAQTKLAQDRDVKVRKEGGSTPTVKASTLKAITDMAEQDFGTEPDPADVRVRARPLAEEATRMMREQNLTESEATRRVYEKARSQQVFAGMRPAVSRAGTKPGIPLPLPKRTAGMTYEEWSKKLQKNQYYPQGLWDGSQFVPESAARSAADDEDEEDDDASD